MINRKKWLILSFLAIFLFSSFLQGNSGNYNDYNKKSITNSEPYPSDIQVGSYLVPGVSGSVTLDQIVKIGLLDDMNHFSGEHAWNGAVLAAREINEGGGILINGTQYYIGLVYEHTNEVDGDVSEGVIAAGAMINNHDPHFITGGYDHKVTSYLEVIMDDKIPFLGTGSSYEELCKNVLNDYNRYKYFFRVMPINDTRIGYELFLNILALANHLNATYGGTVDKIALLHENTTFVNTLSTALKDGLPLYSKTVVADRAFPLNATKADFETYWNDIEAAEAQITVMLNIMPLKQLGVLIARAYQAVQPRCLLYSASMIAQTPPYWDDTEGACQFEITYQAIHNTSKTSLTIPYFNSFVRAYGVEPFYTGTGSYDAVNLLAYAVNESQSFNSDTIVKTLEKINASNPWTGAGGNLAFWTPSHDVLAGYLFGHGIFCQYKYIDGTKVVIPNPLVYPDYIATGSLRPPYWGINGLLTDPPDRPGDFTLDYVESPDLDGKFNLTWTVSEGAENYSIYMSDKPITYISKKFNRLAYQTATSPFPISKKQGDYYFRVVAYNETGETMSSNEVHVTIPGPGSFNLFDDAGDPDTDGNFNLFWTESERADNYSVYRHDKMITEINGSLTLLAHQTTATAFPVTFPVTGLSNGEYYFVVVAWNEMGLTLSDEIRHVIVRLPSGGPDIGPYIAVISIISAGSVIGIASIWLKKRYPKHKGKIKKRKTEHKLKK